MTIVLKPHYHRLTPSSIGIGTVSRVVGNAGHEEERIRL